ncbi:Putative signal transducing protein [Pedobacter steynii]|uniref:Putative signal transducing protein n=1 Tax=Pedobacter steynii TaxID=430522 RepID=A0A1H0HIG0_9SPHI|nr:DUF2007 domain-containing protein [Pedobacter steynii]NQX42603.1 DUF2007 domain-containing protein [Pedobacter steynii]SDO18897.1 Putative signal transducing protein [Pedobacter steynii]
MDKIVVLETFYNPIEANIVKARLLDSDVQCFLSDENSVTINPLYTQALGGVKLHVFERDVLLAKSILQEEGLENSFEEEKEGLLVEEEGESPVAEQAASGFICPDCGSSHVGYVQATKNRFNIFTTVVSLLLMVYPFKARQTHHCFDCGHEFDM